MYSIIQFENLSFDLIQYHLTLYVLKLYQSKRERKSVMNKLAPLKGYQIICPKCQRHPKQSINTGGCFVTHICHQNCGNVFWTLMSCPGCQYPQSTMFVERPRYSELIQCKHCKSAFYLFRCPSKQCQSLFFKFKGKYSMGLPLHCEECKLRYKTIVCRCGGEVFKQQKQIIIEGHTDTKCRYCKKSIIYTLCNNCFTPIYQDDPLDLGARIKCQKCKNNSAYVPCPSCGRTTQHNKFNYCMHYSCQFCDKSFEYSKCPFCSGQNYHYTQKPLGPSRVCSNPKCKQNYFVINCHKCQSPVYFEQFNTKQARQQDCPKCKEILKFYFCQKCKNFNSKDSKCSNAKCPPPTQVKSYYRQAKQLEQKKLGAKNKELFNLKNADYQASECKVCYDRKSEMVNIMCGHVMMCQICCREYLTKNRKYGDTAECPICRKIGLFTKTIQYKYV